MIKKFLILFLILLDSKNLCALCINPGPIQEHFGKVDDVFFNDYPFKLHQTYLIYAWQSTEFPDLVITNKCTHTKKIAEAKEDLQIIGPGKNLTH